MKKFVGIPERKTFWNITTDKQKALILAVVNIAMLPLGLLFILVFNCWFLRKRTK